MKTATKIKEKHFIADGNKALYKVSPPVKVIRYNYRTQELYEDGFTDYILASAIYENINKEPETCLFASDGYGQPLDWGSLPGSQAGTLNISKVMMDAGYTIVEA